MFRFSPREGSQVVAMELRRVCCGFAGHKILAEHLASQLCLASPITSFRNKKSRFKKKKKYA